MPSKPKIIIVATHPIQYQAPWFRYLHNNVPDYDFEVLYLSMPDAQEQGYGFERAFEWDIPLLDDYRWTALDPAYLANNQGIDAFFSLRLTHTKSILNQYDPFAVLLTGWQSFALLQLLKACNSLAVPVLIRGDSNYLKPRKSLTKILHRQLLKRYQKFLSVGAANKTFYLQNGVSESDIYHCPHFVDNDFFHQQIELHANNTSALRAKWQIPNDAFCFCYVGKLTSKKRILDILQAYRKIDSESVHLLIVGSGELMDQAEALVNQFGLNVSFSGFLNQSEITQAYAVSDCLVLASDVTETWGLVVNESMACGVPAIVSDHCGCHEDVIENGKTGYTFEFGSISDLASKMNDFVNMSDEKYRTICQQAQTMICKDYSIEVATKGLLNALRSL